MFKSGIRVGRIFGIEVRADWSWFFIFVLVTAGLAGGLFPAWHPEWPAALVWFVAVAASLLFFASVVAHEFAHSLVARSFGVPVRRITLFLFGGVSNIEREPPSAGSEFLIAVVGPLTSIVIGLLCGMFTGFLAAPAVRTAGDPLAIVRSLGPGATLMLWLSQINVLVALFNLLPGFPLDGGRMLRALLWRWTHDLVRATRWAAGAGQVLAWAFILLGVGMAVGLHVPVLGTGFLNGVWLVLIGWFLQSAALASYGRVALEHSLEDVSVSRLMHRDVHGVDARTSVREFVDEWLVGTAETSFLVEMDGVPAGVASLADVRRTPREAWVTTRVGEIMTPLGKLESVSPEDDASEVLRRFLRADVPALPVLEGSKLAGLVRRVDLHRWIELHPAAR